MADIKGTTTPTSTSAPDTPTGRIVNALRVIRAAMAHAGNTRSNYPRWQLVDAHAQLTDGDVPAAVTALRKAVAHQQAIVHDRLANVDHGRTEAQAAAQALAILTGTDTTNPDLIALHTQAENALATALHHLRSLDMTPAGLKAATARACRAATALKRLQALEGGAT